MDKLNITVILGSAREGRWSEKAAKYVVQQLEKHEELNIKFVDVKDYLDDHTVPAWIKTDKVMAISEIMKAADGYIFVVPEYNHGYPGEFKIFFDKLSSEDTQRKPVAFCGVSDGGLGGARVVEQLIQVSVTRNLLPTRNAVYFSNVDKIFDENGIINAPEFEGRIEKQLTELTWYAKVLKEGREKYS